MKNFFYLLFVGIIAALLFVSDDAKTIIAGVAIFLVGMFFMEDGFKSLSGGVLQTFLQKMTSSMPKALFSGFLATAIVQSSSLISIVIISFLSAELISLSGAIGVIFGSNIGTTTTAWIVSTFGLKIKIATLAMPMLTFGVIFRFAQQKSLQALGNILVGLGFVFLGISFMKDGFETLKAGIDLASFSVDGNLGIALYVLLGIVATVIIQSSSATMALIITALATGQIIYFNALALAIGANVGTTITAILGSLASNSDGKRLAVAHFIFNILTAIVAIVFIYQLADLVSFLSVKIGIDKQDYAMQLALFHTIFNLLGVLLILPFTKQLVSFLEKLFISNERELSHARYLDSTVVSVGSIAVVALQKEVEHLYDNATEALSHALSLHRHTYIGMNEDISKLVRSSVKQIDIDLDHFYATKIKVLYGEILSYATQAQEHLEAEQNDRIYELKVACRDIVETIKEVKELQKNVNFFMKSENAYIRDEYNFLREQIATTLDGIHLIRKSENQEEIEQKLETLKQNLEKLDMIANGRIDKLIRHNRIEPKMATSLLNDSSFTYRISKRLIEIATILWVKNPKEKS